MMRRTPGFSAAIVLTLALGIGATTAVFSVVYGALFRPLPYPDPDRLVVIRLERVLEGAQRPVKSGFPLGDLEELQSRAHAFASFALVSSEQATLSHGGFNHQVNAASVSPSFFVTVGGAMRSGRPFTSEKEPSSIVISDRLRRRLFGEEEAIGRTLVLGKRSYAVVGIASRAFQIPAADTDVWLPASGSNCCPYAAVARLKPAVSLQQASADVEAMLPLLAATSPRIYAGVRGLVVPLREELAGDVRRPLLVLLGLVGLLLSVSCANAANLLVARNAARWREMAVRMALGASPQRLRLQSLVEASLIATASGVLGIALTVGVINALLWLPLEGVPRLGIDATAIRIDLPVLFFSVATAAMTAVFMGLLSTMTHGAPVANLRGDLRGAGISAGPARRRLDNVLVVAQLAVSVVLLVAAGLLGRSLVRLVGADIGVRPDHVATAAIDVAYQRRLTDAQQSSLVDMVLQRVRLLPKVQAAGAGAALPPSASTIRLTLKRFGDSVDYQATAVPATPGYFSALGVRLINGRFFSDADREGQPEVTIMTLDTARRFFGDGNPIGRTIALPVLRNGAAGTAQATLVGVIANVRYSGLDAAADDVVYRPLRQQGWPVLFVVARTAGDPDVLSSMLRREIAAIDPAIVVSSVKSLEAIIAGESAPPRLRSRLAVVLAGCTLAIAVVGLYGVLAQRISGRTKEFGVRMALGASRTHVFKLVFAEGGRLVSAGLLVGIGTAAATSRLLQSLLYEIRPTDLASFAIAAGLLLILSAIAIYVPARRLATSNPIAALRAE
jgi:putative ABC transport system permease protein